MLGGLGYRGPASSWLDRKSVQFSPDLDCAPSDRSLAICARCARGAVVGALSARDSVWLSITQRRRELLCISSDGRGLSDTKPNVISLLEQKSEPWLVKRNETKEWCPDWEFGRETNNLSPKENIYEIRSPQQERVRVIREIRCQVDRQQGLQEGHFRQAVIPFTSMQCTAHREHQWIPTGEKSCECRKCKNAFRCQSCPIQHEIIHNKEKGPDCGECRKIFNSGSDLIKLQRLNESKNHSENNKCAFNRDSGITHPRSINTGEKPHKCKECGKAFHSSSQLSQHQRMHLGEKPCKCRECGKAFPSTAQLNLHQRIHTDEKCYECKECGKAFIRPSHLF
ncbi:PREDICTED: zinc finger protein 461-like [Colobus angolensis palliatus]|uniref:zinc finger protein 461-like n=1 Tax=Colobus angolensis palliatus TaxID=336983 RepID=UPI0005F49C12|nr:PREDICTED: zinc finger protein 461-like [Colobus angolensis palliatus]